VALIASLAQAGITRKELQGLEAGNLIRIEKRLVAEQRLNGTLSKNDVVQIMYVLKNHAPELQEIAGYDGFWSMLTGADATNLDTLRQYDADELERLKHLVSVYFKDDLYNYISVNTASNRWSNLRAIWHYRPFYRSNISGALIDKLASRIHYAIELLNKHPSTNVLKQKLSFLTDEKWFMLLSDIDEKRIKPVVEDFLRYLYSNSSYTKSKSAYFKHVFAALSCYRPNDGSMAAQIVITRLRCLKARGHSLNTRLIVSAVVAMVVTLVIGILIHRSNGEFSSEPVAVVEKDTTDIIKAYHPEADSATDKHGNLLTRNHFWQTDTPLQMYTFAQARMYPINYPFESWKASRLQVNKYANPFTPAIFEKDYRKVMHLNGPIIKLFNQTDKGCIAIAYYNSYFNADSNRYVRLKRRADEKIYAFYIPPQDSIRLDLKMMRLRFYMGSRLARFQAKGYHCPDSLDAKFSKFTPADSVLFSNALAMGYHHYDGTQEKYSLRISQPDEYRYQIYWGGKAINLYRTYSDTSKHKKSEDITQYQPLILDARDPADDQSRYVRSFIGWQ
jgi:hypothetical protein